VREDVVKDLGCLHMRRGKGEQVEAAVRGETKGDVEAEAPGRKVA
jgi:hypothetical protein